MGPMSRLSCLPALGLLLALGCADDDRPGPRDAGPFDGGTEPVDATFPDVVLPDAPFSTDAACATATSMAEVDVRPVDILWVIDNSASMEPAIAQVQEGLNDFALEVAGSGLDYRVIMLSLQGVGESSGRFRVCIPPPLAGDGSCGDGERFFHVSVDIRSTQPVEQILGTLGQTAGYTSESDRGSEPWRDLLREDSTKTIVVVTDDNSRTCDEPGPTDCGGGDPPLTVTSLEDFPGGGNPFSSRELGPGILTDEYGDLFEGYTFNAIYGWGDESDPNVICSYPGGEMPPSPGPTYTSLVERTGGVRAQICQQASSAAWEDFFEAVATRVEETARIECELDLPPPPDGMTLNPDKINVFLESGGESELVPGVMTGDRCGVGSGGWYYDDPDDPSTVILCDASCEEAQRGVREEGSGAVNVVFGCDTILI